MQPGENEKKVKSNLAILSVSTPSTDAKQPSNSSSMQPKQETSSASVKSMKSLGSARPTKSPVSAYSMKSPISAHSDQNAHAFFYHKHHHDRRATKDSEQQSDDSSLELRRVLSRETMDYEPDDKDMERTDKIYVVFEEDDPENPYNWSLFKKWLIVSATSYSAFASAGIGSSYSMGNDDLRVLVHTSKEMTHLAFSIYNLGFGVGPLLLAPLSESWGRKPIYLSTLIVFFILIIPLALGHSIAEMVIFRFFVGFFGSTGSSMVGGTITDMFHAKSRGWPMMFFTCGTFFGSGILPTAMAFAADHRGYRFMCWMQFLIAGVSPILILLFVEETRGGVLLSRKAAKLRKETGDERYTCKADEGRQTLIKLISSSLSRPMKMLFTEIPVISISLWVGFAWATLFVCLVSVKLVFQHVYHFNLEDVGLVFLATPAAAIANIFLYIWQARMYDKHVGRKGPEARLYAAAIGGILLPSGLFIFGFSQGRGHWMGPIIGVGVIYAGVIPIYLAAFLYMADAYGAYASSAMAAQSLLRNVFAMAFPLFTVPMFYGMGFTWAPFLAGMVGWILALVPFLLYAYGHKFRERSAYNHA